MWWVWLVGSLAVAGALLAVAVTALETWRRVRRLRAGLDVLAADARRAQEVVDDLATAAEGLAR